MRVSLVLHPAARATLNGAILRVLLLHRRGVFQHVEHAVVLIRRLRGRFSLLLLLIVAAVWLIRRSRRINQKAATISNSRSENLPRSRRIRTTACSTCWNTPRRCKSKTRRIAPFKVARAAGWRTSETRIHGRRCPGRACRESGRARAGSQNRGQLTTSRRERTVHHSTRGDVRWS